MTYSLMLLLTDSSFQGLHLAVVGTGIGPQRMRFESGQGWCGLSCFALNFFILSDAFISFPIFFNSFFFSFSLFFFREGGEGSERAISRGEKRCWLPVFWAGRDGGTNGAKCEGTGAATSPLSIKPNICRVCWLVESSMNYMWQCSSVCLLGG